MIGAVVFIIFFIVFLGVTFRVPTMPPGNMVQQILGIPFTDYPVLSIPAWILINAIVNGVAHGFVIWLIFTIAKAVIRRKSMPAQTVIAAPSD